MTAVTFKRTISDCQAFFSVGYTEKDGDNIEGGVPLENDQGRYTFPDGVSVFVLKCTMQGKAGGSVALEMKVGARTLEPGFKRTLKPGEHGTIVVYQAHAL